MGLHRDIIAMLDSCGNSNSSWAATDALPLKLSVLQFLIHILRVVRRDIDERRVKLHEFVDGLEKGFRTIPFQRRQYLKGEASLACILFDIICYCHNRVSTQYATKLRRLWQIAKFCLDFSLSRW